MIRSPLRVAAALLALAATLAPASAKAFCRTWSCDPVEEKKKGRECPPDPGNKECLGGIAGEHKPLFWPQKCIGFSLNAGASKKLDPSIDKARAKFARIADLSFATWQKADCGGGKRPSLSFTDLGFIECDKQEFNGYNTQDEARPTAQGNANLIVFRDTWPKEYADSGNALALTTLTFNTKTGEIYDADIEINGERAITTSDVSVQDDLQSILTHEVGHFVGIAHSTDPDATMFATYASGTTSLRDLSADDVNAVCAIYKPERTGLPACDPTPRHGYASKCAVDSPAPSGCSTAGVVGLPFAQGGFSAALLAGAAALRARRRRNG